MTAVVVARGGWRGEDCVLSVGTLRMDFAVYAMAKPLIGVSGENISRSYCYAFPCCFAAYPQRTVLPL